jgi:hypothetical protein
MVSTKYLFRLTGFLTIFGAMVFGVSEILDALGGDPFTTVSAFSEMLAFVLLPFGILGLFLYQRERAGKLGLLGVLLYGAGSALNVALLGGVILFQSLIPSFAGAPTVMSIMTGGGGSGLLILGGMIGALVGMLLFGIASWRSHILPKYVAPLITIGVVLANVVLFASPQLGHALNMIMLAGLFLAGYYVIKNPARPENDTIKTI